MSLPSLIVESTCEVSKKKQYRLAHAEDGESNPVSCLVPFNGRVSKPNGIGMFAGPGQPYWGPGNRCASTPASPNCLPAPKTRPAEQPSLPARVPGTPPRSQLSTAANKVKYSVMSSSRYLGNHPLSPPLPFHLETLEQGTLRV